MTTIRPARPEEADAVSALAIRSKAHWDYTAEQMAVFRDELTMGPDELRANHAHVAEADGVLLGFFTLCPAEEGAALELQHLFVDPDRLARGTGTRLFQKACAVAVSLDETRLVIMSDPNAAGFYQKLGCTLEREIPSSIPGRTIPYFSLRLAPQSGN